MSQRRKKTNLLISAIVILALFWQTVGPLIQAQENTQVTTGETITDPTATPVVTETQDQPSLTPSPSPLTDTNESPSLTPTPTPETDDNDNQITEAVSPTPSITLSITPTVSPTIAPDTTTTEVEDTVAAEANSGGNQANGSGSEQTGITTGEANAAGQQANVVEGENISVGATGQVSADTGQNQANNNQSIVTSISTGDAVAFLNLVNLLNTQLVDSEVKVYFINLSDTAEINANLNDVWKKMLTEGTPEATPLDQNEVNNILNISNGNTQLTTEVNVNANSGGNQTNNGGGIAIIKAGNATALANVINLINTNLISSKYLIGTINITGDYEGDLILPRLEMFMRDGQVSDPVLVNQAMGSLEMINQVHAVSETGSNSGDNSQGSNIVTGSSAAIANTFVEAGINRFFEGSFFLMVNNLGNWNGQVFGWESPESRAGLSGLQNILYRTFNFQTESSGTYQTIDISGGNVSSINNINVSAGSGNNQAEGNYQSDIYTGNSVAMANLFNFANINYYQNLRFFGLVNILGNWKGNIVFAYPDMAINMKAGEINYDQGVADLIISVKNVGFDEADNVKIHLEVPEGIELTDRTKGIVINEKETVFMAGKMKMGDQKDIAVTVKIKPEVLKDNGNRSLTGKLIKAAWASEEERSVEMLVRSKVVTSDPESNPRNNTSAVNVIYKYPDQKAEPAANQTEGDQQPEESENHNLVIRATNNVGDYVYPGDVVTFEIEIDNQSALRIEEAKLFHIIVNSKDEVLTQTAINIDNIRANTKGRIRYGIPLPDGAGQGDYISVTSIKGRNSNGAGVESNQSQTYFKIKTKTDGVLKGQTETVDPEGGARILGLTNLVSGLNGQGRSDDFWPYLILFLSSAVWLRINLAQIIQLIEARRPVNLKPTTYALLGIMILLFTMSTGELFKTKQLRRLKFNLGQTQLQINNIIGADRK